MVRHITIMGRLYSFKVAVDEKVRKTVVRPDPEIRDSRIAAFSEGRVVDEEGCHRGILNGDLAAASGQRTDTITRESCTKPQR